MSKEASVSAQLRRLAQYNRAVTAEYGDDTHAQVSDFYAKDLAQICADVDGISQQFLTETLETRGNSWYWERLPQLKVPQFVRSISLPSISSFTMEQVRRLVDTAASVFRVYLEYQKVQLKAAEREERKERKRKKRRLNKGERRTWRCGQCTYINMDSKANQCEMCLKVTEEREQEGEEASESEGRTDKQRGTGQATYAAIETETVQNAILGLAAVGTGVGAARAVMASRGYAKKAEEVLLCREGDETALNGDLTNVAPLNTGRLVASDAEHIVNSVAATGVDVPSGILNTSRDVFRLVSSMNKSLTDMEAYYARERTRELKKGAIFLTSSVAFILSLVAKFSMPVQRGALLFVLSLSALAFPKKNTADLERARQSTLQLVGELAHIRSTAPQNKQQLRGMVSQALANHQQRARDANLAAAAKSATPTSSSRSPVSERPRAQPTRKTPVAM